MDIATVLLNLAYVSLIAATATRTMVWLRVALIAAALSFITFGILTDLPSMIFWNVVIGSLHAVQLIRHLRGRTRVELTASESHWCQRLFPGLAPSDFAAIWDLGCEVPLRDKTITEQGRTHGKVGVITDGTVEVRLDGEVVAHLGPGELVGEMSYLTNTAATADTAAVGPVTIRVWNGSSLRALEEENQAAAQAFSGLLERDLAHKMLRSNDFQKLRNVRATAEAKSAIIERAPHRQRLVTAGQR